MRETLARVLRHLAAEDVGVTAFYLGVRVLGDSLDREGWVLLMKKRDRENENEEHVPGLLEDFLRGGVRARPLELVRLLDKIGENVLDGLLAVPRAAVLAAKHADEIEKSVHRALFHPTRIRSRRVRDNPETLRGAGRFRAARGLGAASVTRCGTPPDALPGADCALAAGPPDALQSTFGPPPG